MPLACSARGYGDLGPHLRAEPEANPAAESRQSLRTGHTRHQLIPTDKLNTAFWNELCGTEIARSLGITDDGPDELRRFDDAYLAYYPYLTRYLQLVAAPGTTVLEIGLGYGTAGQFLAERGVVYHGIDIAPEPVRMMRHRLALLGLDSTTLHQARATDLPFADQGFDAVVSIGCLHHTGDLAGSVREVHRVLRPGGTALVMTYNTHSFRRLVFIPALRVRNRLRGGRPPIDDLAVRAMYDADSQGRAAPHTDFVSARDARRLFSQFSSVTVRRENFDTLSVGPLVIPRKRLLGNVAHILGLDLYVVATK